MASALRAAVVGVGRVGSRFDEEPGRKVPWSHVGAYLARPDHFNLVGVCEIDKDNAAAFRHRCPDVPVYDDIDTLLKSGRPDIVSVCTPAERHENATQSILTSEGIRVIWCEKPLSSRLDAAEKLVNSAAANGVRILVSFNRRWLPIWCRARDI